jgi:hypothetical protein
MLFGPRAKQESQRARTPLLFVRHAVSTTASTVFSATIAQTMMVPTYVEVRFITKSYTTLRNVTPCAPSVGIAGILPTRPAISALRKRRRQGTREPK